MKVDLFDFHLPESSIALRPAEPRDSARLLVVDPSAEPLLFDHVVTDLADFIRPGDAVIFNDTKVIPAQLKAKRTRLINDEPINAGVEFTLHMRVAEDRWRAFARPAKKLIKGDKITFSEVLTATVIQKSDGGEVDLNFNLAGHDLDVAIANGGAIPLPPYIALKRDVDARDEQDYQTIYADKPGAVAAPTAGLHTTQSLLKALKGKGASLHYLTLHVGAGTFLPVKSDDTDDHKMHAEIGSLSVETAAELNRARANGGRLIAVGTTSLRLLESATDENGVVSPFNGPTDIFITPGYRFKAVDILMTNFHLPKSTLFMLVSAFSGTGAMKRAYVHAIDKGYRFYSYGDASLLYRHDLPENLRKL